MTAGTEHICKQQFRAVFDASLLLHIIAGGGKTAGREDRVSARKRHLVDDKNGGAGIVGFNSGRQPGKTGADTEHVDSLVPFLRGFDWNECVCGWNSSGKAGAEQLTAVEGKSHGGIL